MSETKLDLTKPMQTRSGLPARLLVSDLRGALPMAFVVTQPDGTELVRHRRVGGRLFADRDSELDIINVPTKIVAYVNAYPDRTGYMYPSSAEADLATGSRRIARIRIEFTEGQFDD